MIRSQAPRDTDRDTEALQKASAALTIDKHEPQWPQRPTALLKLLGPRVPSGPPDLMKSKKEPFLVTQNCHIYWPLTTPLNIPPAKET